MGIPFKKRHLTILLSALLSAGLMYYLYRDFNFLELFSDLKNINKYYLLSFIGIYLCTVFIRTFRYWFLVGTHNIGFFPIFLTTIVRNMFVDLLPARLGSISYIIILKKKFNIDYDIGAVSLGLSIFFDIAVMFPLLLMAVIYMLYHIGSDVINIDYNLYIAVLLMVNIVFIIAIFFLDRLILMAKKITDYFSNLLRLRSYKVPKIILEFLDRIFADIIKAKKNRTYFLIFILSFALRILKYMGLYFLLLAIVFPFGLENYENLSFFSSFLGTAATEMSEFLPIKGIGGIGTWHFVWAKTFEFLNILDFELAKKAGIMLHTITQLIEYSAGIIVLLYIISLKKRMDKKALQKEEFQNKSSMNL